MMKDYVISAASRDAVTAACDLLAATGQRIDATPPRGLSEEIAPEQFGPVTWFADVTWYSEDPLPALPDGVTVTEGPNGFTAARVAAAPVPGNAGGVPRPDWYTVTLVQARSVCDLQGLTPKIDALIAAMPDGPQKVVARNAWERGDTISFDSPLLNALWPLLGLDEAHKEALFKAAHAIRT
jgi:hypothetical protein